jgi:hypothetical protein
MTKTKNKKSFNHNQHNDHKDHSFDNGEIGAIGSVASAGVAIGAAAGIVAGLGEMLICAAIAGTAAAVVGIIVAEKIDHSDSTTPTIKNSVRE